MAIVPHRDNDDMDIDDELIDGSGYASAGPEATPLRSVLAHHSGTSNVDECNNTGEIVHTSMTH